VLLHDSAVLNDAVGVAAAAPKLMPIIVTDPPEVTPMLSGMLTLAHGAAGSPSNSQPKTSIDVARRAPSKLNCPVIVPTSAPTLTAVRTSVPPYARGAHATVVADVHALLPHASAAVSEAVAVGPDAPKLRPQIVTVPPKVGAALVGTNLTLLTTGAAEEINVAYARCMAC
jgi:hypothetical protein